MGKILILSADRSTASGSASNLGDGLLTDALITALHAHGHAVAAVDFGEGSRKTGEARLPVRGVVGLSRAVRSADLVIIGGGTMLQDDVGRGWGGLPRLCAVTSLIAHLAGRELAYFGVGCDPVPRVLARVLLRVATWSRTIWVRDRDSARRAADLGGRDVRLAADACLLAVGAASGHAAASRRGAVICIAHGDADLVTADAVSALQERFGRVSFVQMDQRPDQEMPSASLTRCWPCSMTLVPSCRGSSCSSSSARSRWYWLRGCTLCIPECWSEHPWGPSGRG
ncbi:MAG: polysaccharide pyruvyl transferase family protein [Micropruina sp.]|nr:polysaccharide pyruvyl transferase family protein [Micropruina sp.]